MKGELKVDYDLVVPVVPLHYESHEGRIERYNASARPLAALIFGNLMKGELKVSSSFLISSSHLFFFESHEGRIERRAGASRSWTSSQESHEGRIESKKSKKKEGRSLCVKSLNLMKGELKADWTIIPLGVYTPRIS